MVFADGDGQYRFRVYLPAAARVEVVGAFTGWHRAPVPMLRHEPGWWEARVEIEPGEHEFCYLVDGSVWLADYAASGVRISGHGHWVSRLTCSATDAPAHKRSIGALTNVAVLPHEQGSSAAA